MPLWAPGTELVPISELLHDYQARCARDRELAATFHPCCGSRYGSANAPASGSSNGKQTCWDSLRGGTALIESPGRQPAADATT